LRRNDKNRVFYWILQINNLTFNILNVIIEAKIRKREAFTSIFAPDSNTACGVIINLETTYHFGVVDFHTCYVTFYYVDAKGLFHAQIFVRSRNNNRYAMY